MQTMATQLGGQATSADKHEYGFAKVRARNHSPLLSDIMDEVNDEGCELLDVWMSHSIEVKQLPEGFKLIASTENCDIAGFANVEKHYYGLQFHPEVTHTKQGVPILERFVTGICCCKKNWTTDNIISDLIQNLKNKIGNDNVLLGLSGGVDSSVVAVLLHEAIGNQLTCVFVDNGLLGLNEGGSRASSSKTSIKA
jgi:GMP synthase (glutamine-hydrolysing)